MTNREKSWEPASETRGTGHQDNLVAFHSPAPVLFQLVLHRVPERFNKFMMEPFTASQGFFILLFCVLVPCLDQYTDLTMVVRLFRGPQPSSRVKCG